MRDDFAIFIPSHGRAEQIALTITALRKSRYSGAWFIVLDDEDESREEYERKWGAERVLTFSKDAVASTFDMGDNLSEPRGVVVYARNAIPLLAAERGFKYHMQLDDDYTYFAHRINREGTLTYAYSYRLDAVIDAFIEFLEDSGALTVAFAQGGDFIGGIHGTFKAGVRRKAMNTFIARTERPITFVGRINEDTNTYVLQGTRGELFFTITDFAINQMNTQQQDGGLTGAYLEQGTYVKSFYTVLFAPSCAKISTIGESGHRVHHHISWNNAVPKILSSRFKREAVT